MEQLTPWQISVLFLFTVCGLWGIGLFASRPSHGLFALSAVLGPMVGIANLAFALDLVIPEALPSGATAAQVLLALGGLVAVAIWHGMGLVRIATEAVLLIVRLCVRGVQWWALRGEH